MSFVRNVKFLQFLPLKLSSVVTSRETSSLTSGENVTEQDMNVLKYNPGNKSYFGFIPPLLFSFQEILD